MLGHQLPSPLPPFESFWSTLDSVFGWLDGTRQIAQLPRAEVGQPDATWDAPQAITSWRRQVPLELLRYAGANRLKVDIDYRAEQDVMDFVESSLMRCGAHRTATSSSSSSTTRVSCGAIGSTGSLASGQRPFRFPPATESSSDPGAAAQPASIWTGYGPASAASREIAGTTDMVGKPACLLIEPIKVLAQNFD